MYKPICRERYWIRSITGPSRVQRARIFEHIPHCRKCKKDLARFLRDEDEYKKSLTGQVIVLLISFANSQQVEEEIFANDNFEYRLRSLDELAPFREDFAEISL